MFSGKFTNGGGPISRRDRLPAERAEPFSGPIRPVPPARWVIEQPASAGEAQPLRGALFLTVPGANEDRAAGAARMQCQALAADGTAHLWARGIKARQAAVQRLALG